ncbi:MAG: ABC transporter ATP-binding protein [Desulfarculus sp.]|nr:ABC transporter ATP-binding protein [Desulfarculus sp.]
MNILSVQDLGKNFGGLTAVKDLSFKLKQGEILALIGPNGAGKTTVFACLSGFLHPEQGQVLLEGKSLRALSPHRICGLGLARTFQIVRPFLNISVLDNVMVGAFLRHKSVAQAREEALKVLDFMGLARLAHKEAGGLPLPQRKRLELAKALATGPRVLLLDEVMAGLNPTEVDELIALIRDINQRGVSILLIEHVMRGVMALAQRVLVINYGQLIAQGTPAEVVGNQEVIAAYLGRGLGHA